MDFLNNYFKYQNESEIVGLTPELNIFYILNYFQKTNKNILIITNTLYEANKYFDSISTYTDDCLLFPMDDFVASVALAISPELKIKRLETINVLKENNRKIVVTNLMGLLRYLPDYKSANKLEFKLQTGMSINRDKILEVLDSFGYKRDTLVTSTGEYAVRGYVIDLFLIEQEHPIRIEFFGNEIESIRFFDENTQMSIKEITEITCLPYQEITTSVKSSILDYLDIPMVFEIDKEGIDLGYEKLSEEILTYKKENDTDKNLMFELEDINIKDVIYLNKFINNRNKALVYQSNTLDNFNSNFQLLREFVNKKLEDKKTVIFCLSRKAEIDFIKEMFHVTRVVDEEHLFTERVNILNKKINNGFEFDKYVVIGEYDIEKINNREIKYKNSYKIGKKIKGFDQLQVGDYVVHTIHGIGQYQGVISLTKNGVVKDYLQIIYADNDKIYVPVEKISTIFKYSSKDGVAPVLSKLNGTAWAKTKKALQKKIHDISLELIKLYAARSKVTGPVFKDDPMDVMFDADFKYEPTIDQQKAFLDVKKDLENKVPMDRLLCGDVGFGKTEVAFRAMFMTAINGFQVAYLCPTTILSNQQYENALQRFKNFPVEIALLNRFTTKKEAERIIDGLKKGTIDIVFGTHRLLSDDVGYKNLGLLVVDEEQRFGVSHKEKIKKYKNDVNVLTLSATPIPRTLKMAMSGLRDLSIIDTAPVNRYPVQTYVIKEQDMVVKDAIYKELGRNGQIFVLYNRIDSIESKKDELEHLVPEARIVIAHGRMNKSQMEDVMQDFIDHKYDILLCTTIIETGIDISNANTLIIYDADRFGLSQLYQIRGRVGRSSKIAYAYLMYSKDKMLNEIAVKRLEAIKEFTELGSGYRIAMRDLSLRGAGDILGSDQAGFVDAVGLDLYMKMVDDEVKRLNGEEPIEDKSNNSLIDVDTHISDSYVSDESLKIEIHQKINEIDSFDKLIEIQKELEDRFGKINEQIKIYMYEEWFEKLALSLHIERVVQNNKIVELEIPANLTKKLKFDKLFMQIYNICPKIQFRSMLNNVYITLPIGNLPKHFVYYLVDILNLIKDEVSKEEITEANNNEV
ncbi:transcription-repair coupling factor [Mycoplasma sp. CAG:956]|nr:transcription-repair coupling factor [Mycoplasma sp. CAG:956]